MTLGFSAWYFLSVSQFWTKVKSIDWIAFLASRPPLTSEDIVRLKDKYLILLVAIGEIETADQYWQPLYLIKTTNIRKTVHNLNQQIKQREVNPQKDVGVGSSSLTEQRPIAIRYYLFRHYHSEIFLNRAFSKWLVKSRLKPIGFNQFGDIFR